jgi:hypothetical protein
MYIPLAFERETGVRIGTNDAKAIKYAVLGRKVQPAAYDESQLQDALHQAGLAGVITTGRARELIHECVLPSFDVALQGIHEGARLAKHHQVAVMIHTSAPSEEAAYAAADIAGPLLVAGHTNHPTFTVEEAVACARTLKRKEAYVEVSTLALFRGRDTGFGSGPDTIYALLANDLVDIVATDYAGGDWDNVYFSLGRAVADGVVGLPKAVALATRNVTLAYPTLAPERGEIRAGCVADIVVCREQLQNVERVYIGGRLVCERGAVRQGELIREGAG